MPVSIDSCPGCQAPVLPDTVMCPACGRVLKDDEPQKFSTVGEIGLVTAEMEDPCRKCGQMVRSGLLRCWNCNEFMRQDIADRYDQLQATPQRILYSETDGEEYLPARAKAKGAGQPTFKANDADFDIDDGASPTIATTPGGDFELGHGLEVATPSESAAPATGGGFDLDSSAEVTPKPGENEEKVIETIPLAQPSDETQSAGESTAETPTTDTKADGAAAGTPPPAIPVPGEEEDLFSVALEEEKEDVARRKFRRRQKRAKRKITGIVVFCPRGHRIEVAMKFAGKKGKCPKCKAPFSVPRPTEEQKQKAEEEADVEKEPTVPWMWDVHLHEVDPSTLKLKAGSLSAGFYKVDLFFGDDGLRVAKIVATKKGRKPSAKQEDAARESIREHLVNKLALKDLPVGESELIKTDDLSLLAVVQPALLPHESIFAGVPVFGEGMIAVRLTPGEDNKLRFLSFGLAKFRQFSKQLAVVHNVEDFGDGLGIPFEEEFETAKCHFSDNPVKSLKAVEYYQADVAYALELVGRKCAMCGIVVSEDYRKKEKLGGAAGRGIAKAKCPKCTGKFGDISLYSMEIQDESEEEAGDGANQSAAVGSSTSNEPADLDAAITKARSEVDSFVEQLSSGSGEKFGVKSLVEDGDKSEHVWLTDIVYSDDKFEGVIADEPEFVKNVEVGKKWTVSKTEISDWQFIREGKLHGNYTKRASLKSMPQEEADQFRSQLADP